MLQIQMFSNQILKVLLLEMVALTGIMIVFKHGLIWDTGIPYIHKVFVMNLLQISVTIPVSIWIMFPIPAWLYLTNMMF